ncbi:hypothetical protein Tco_0098144 [Tanacetum coccineum]
MMARGAPNLAKRDLRNLQTTRASFVGSAFASTHFDRPLGRKKEHVAICEENAKQKWKCTTTQGSLPKPHHKLQARRTSCITEYASRVEEVGKLGPKWEGPYEITKALGNGAYKLRDRDGKQLPRTWNWIGGTELVEAKVVDTAVVITIVAGTPLEVPVLPVKFPTDNGSTKGVQTPIRADHFAVTFSLILSTREWVTLKANDRVVSPRTTWSSDR